MRHVDRLGLVGKEKGQIKLDFWRKWSARSPEERQDVVRFNGDPPFFMTGQRINRRLRRILARVEPATCIQAMREIVALGFDARTAFTLVCDELLARTQ